MKHLILFLFFTSITFSQTAAYNKISKEGNFSEYQSKEGKVLKIGDTVLVSLPANGREYLFITQGNVPTGVILSNTKNIITKIKTVGNTTRGFKTYIAFKGYGMLPVFIEYESALEVGEIKSAL